MTVRDSRVVEECGDFPVFEANPLTLVFQEVPKSGGAGTVPVQFQYSVAVHGLGDSPDAPPTFQRKASLARRGAVTDGIVDGNFVPKLDFIGYYHATCNCLWHRIIVRQKTVQVGDDDLPFGSVCE